MNKLDVLVEVLGYVGVIVVWVAWLTAAAVVGMALWMWGRLLV